MSDVYTVVGLGEALFDVLPEGPVLGGAPLNVAVQAHQLLAPLGGRGMVASRVGADPPGQQVLDELRRRGMSTEAIQVDAEAPTGRVLVTLRDGEPEYEIVENVAWDRLEMTAELLTLARNCQAVCFGTLAQRNATTRTTIEQFLSEARSAVRLFDVNLRQNFFDAPLVQESCRLASVVKLNQEELPRVAELLGLKAGNGADELASRLRCDYDLEAVVLTRGADGTRLMSATGASEARVPVFDREPGADSVGAGDACSAGLLVGLLLGWPPARTVELANTAGAYVASRRGATPTLPEAVKDLVLN